MTSEWILHVLKTWAHSLLHSTALGHLNTFFLINQSWPKMLLWVGEVGWEIVETESMPSWRQLLSVFSRSKSPMCSLVHFTPLPINLEKMNFNKVIDYLNLIILTNHYDWPIKNSQFLPLVLLQGLLACTGPKEFHSVLTARLHQKQHQTGDFTAASGHAMRPQYKNCVSYSCAGLILCSCWENMNI